MEDSFDIYLIDIICNEKIDVTQYMVNKYSLEDNEEKKDIILNTMKIYINGDIEEEHQIKFLVELDSILKNKEFKLKLCSFFEDLQKIFDDNFAFKLLNRLLNYSKKSFELTKFIWSLKIFRNQLKKFNFYSNSQEFLENSIFKNMFTSSVEFMNGHTEKTVNCYKKLLEDEEILEDLIIYINKIVNLNSAYCSESMDLNIKLKKCSKIDFNYFLFKFLKQMYDNYKKKNNIIISRDISQQVKEFNIKDLNLGEKIYITLLQCFRNIVEFTGKKIYTINSTKMHQFSNFLKLILCNEEIQDIFIEYESNFENVKLEEILETCVNYYDFVVAYNVKLNLNISLKKEFYNFISNILGGLNGNIKNAHIRIALFTIIQITYNKTGFNIYNNFFDNLFKYINEVDYAKFGVPYIKNKISHQYFLTEILLQMTDLCKNINEKSKYIFAETVYRLISTSYEYFDIFNEKTAEELKDATAYELLYYSTCYNLILQTILYTILIYNNLYERKIIETVYPELEEKNIYFIGRIFENIKNNKKYIFDFSLYKQKTENLMKYCFEFIEKRLDSNIETIFEIKDNFLNAMKIYKYENYEIIKNKLENYKEIQDYPEHFTDPLTCKMIKKPVMIPNSTEIFDRTSIVSQIYGQGINPYTREKLTLEILEEYNNKEEIKNKIIDFENKIKLWKENI